MRKNNPFDKFLSKEQILHIQVCTYLELQYPKVFFIHPHNEGKRTPYERYLADKMRIRRGAPDILIFAKRGNVSGLAIELKIKPNKSTQAQNDCLDKLSINGWWTKICWDFDGAKAIIDNYLK
ncbi:hypothetical protein LCGC14_0536970 [marine sediment metagenome]|uniref:Uncharacterized protein n=1 Tax=marine sediment metagenome TaxID=412755 RepID=A0A0F9SCD8_9ZZZZ